MNENVVLTPERILETTEEVLRRFGLAKATVVDVARALDVSHGSVYRHFPSEASLRDQYRAGTVIYTDVVTAQATALSARRALITGQVDRQNAAVALIQALGGGWRTGAL